MGSNMQIEMMKRQMIRNPQQFAQNALRSGYFNSSPMHKNALQAIVSGDKKAMEEIAGNLCKEHNVSIEDATKQYKQYYGLS